MEGKVLTNSMGTFSCSPERYFEPNSTEEIKTILESARKENKRVKVSGVFHSPSDIAMTDGVMINMKNMTNVVQIDKDKCQITVEAGCTLFELSTKILPLYGMALSNMSAVPHVTIGGAISTGTHGTGAQHGILATQVLELELLTAEGDILRCSRDSDEDLFRAALCSLGCLGVILTLTIQCQPEYNLIKRQSSCTLDEVLDNLEEHVAGSEYFRFGWFPHTEVVYTSKLNRTKEPLQSSFSWFKDYFLVGCTLQFLYWLSTFLPRLVPSINRFFFNWCFTAPRVDVAPSYSNLTYDCLFQAYVTEWAIPRRQTATVLRELRAWLGANKDVYAHIPVEVRFVKSDDILLSPANGRDTCFINIVMYRPYGKFVPTAKYWAAYENIMSHAGGRPHWAKAHKLTGTDIKKIYPEFQTFCDIRQRLDPDGMFLNEYMERIFL